MVHETALASRLMLPTFTIRPPKVICGMSTRGRVPTAASLLENSEDMNSPMDMPTSPVRMVTPFKASRPKAYSPPIWRST